MAKDKRFKLGDKVRCTGYITKSGWYFNTHNRPTDWELIEVCQTTKDNTIIDNEATETLKDYDTYVLPLYKITEKEFTGIFVGTTYKSTKMRAHWESDSYTDQWLFNREAEQEFAVVYFRNNGKRLVPLDMIFEED